ncbi:hypothetical protein DCM91_17595 [Chitinophaga costaii]|nr:hypothetical protein DCM91_17595 [Chitinophaga costaii]
MADHDDTVAIFLHGTPFTTYTFHLSSSAGLKSGVDATFGGTFTTDAAGAYAWKQLSLLLLAYRDGLLTLRIASSIHPADTLSATSLKEQFLVKNYRDFLAIGQEQQEMDSNATFVQENDFAFPDTIFRDSPIPVKFSGTYNGQGHLISNLTIAPEYTAKASTDVALFDTLGEGAVLKNVCLVLSSQGIQNPNPSSYTAGLVTMHYGTIMNCSVKGNIVFTDPNTGIAGGLVAEAKHAHIVGSSFTGRLEGNKIAGIVGDMLYTDVNMCYANFAAKSDGMIAGILNFTYLADATIPTSISNCYVHFTTIEGAGAANAGAIATDEIQNRIMLSVSNCYSNGPVKRDDSTIHYQQLSELNAVIAAVQAGHPPHYMTATPPHNKPFKAARNATQPPLLWWQ